MGRPDLENATSVVSERLPIRVWFDARDAASAGMAWDTLAATEHAWDVLIDEIGFRAPRLPDGRGGPELDVYLAYGGSYTYHDLDDWGEDPRPHDGYNSRPAWIVIDPTDAFRLDLLAAHELNHASQFAYDQTESSPALREGTATAAEGFTYPDTPYPWYSPISDFQEAPFMPVLLGAGSIAVNWHQVPAWDYEYGAALWVLWLDARYARGRGRGAVALWEATSNDGFGHEPDVVDAFAELAGADATGALAQFAGARLRIGEWWHEIGVLGPASWAGGYAVAASTYVADELPLMEEEPDPPPYVTGQGFVELDLGGLQAAQRASTLQLRVASQGGLSTGLTVVWWNVDGSVGEHVATGWGEVVFELPARDLDRVVLGLTNGGAPGWDGDDKPYVPGDQTWSAWIEGFERGCACAGPGRARSGWLWWLILVVLRRRHHELGRGAIGRRCRAFAESRDQVCRPQGDQVCRPQGDQVCRPDCGHI